MFPKFYIVKLSKESMVKKRTLKESDPIVQKKIKGALNDSLLDGVFSAWYLGLGFSYLIPFALVFNATAAQIAFLTSMIVFIPALIQIKTSKLIEKYSRKKITVIFAFMELGGYFLLISAGSLFLLGYKISALIISGFILLIYILGAPSHVSWFSWMGSLVPEKERGKYFGRRNRYVQFFSFVALILGGFILDYYKNSGIAILGFLIIFTLAFLFRSIAIMILMHQYEPKIVIVKEDELNFLDFLKNLKKTSFGRFSYYLMFLRSLIYFGIPFISVYILVVRGFSYLDFMFFSIALSIFMTIFYPLAGKIADNFGNIRLLRLATFSMAVSLLSWIFSINLYYLIFVTQLFAGFAWAGILLASNNYIYDAVAQEKRGFALANFNLLIGIGMGVGSGLGALFVLLNFKFISSPLLAIFLAGIFLLIFYVFSEGWLREVRHVKQFRYQWLLREVSSGAVNREIHSLNNVRSKVQHIIKVKE